MEDVIIKVDKCYRESDPNEVITVIRTSKAIYQTYGEERILHSAHITPNSKVCITLACNDGSHEIIDRNGTGYTIGGDWLSIINSSVIYPL